MKKAVLFSLVVCSCILTPQVCADISGDYTYTDNGDGTCTIIGYLGPGGDVTLPDTLNGLTVTIIGHRTFYYNGTLISVIISDSVTTIGNGAFEGCYGLTGITIGSGVTDIGDHAFYYCRGLTAITVNTLNSNYSSLDGVLFDKTQTLLIQYPQGRSGDYIIPNSIMAIGNGAFAHCSVTGVTINSNVTTIGDYAFEFCRLAGLFIIPDSVTVVGEWAFQGCPTLMSVTIGNGATSIRDGAFKGCFMLISVTIGNSVTTIGNKAFYGCGNLRSVTIGSGVTVIGDGAFASCRCLTSIVIPESVTTIGDSAFLSCGLSSIVIPDSVTTIGPYAFANCEGLTCVCFKGNPPELGGSSVFFYVHATVYYLPAHAADWPASFGGLLTAVWPLSIADVDSNGDVNLLDFYAFAAAWQSVKNMDTAYDPLCDISDPVDGVIDMADLGVFADNWLITPCP